MGKPDDFVFDTDYTEGGPVVVEGADGEYTFLSNDDLVLSAPGEEDILHEVALDRLRVEAVNNADNYIASRKEDRGRMTVPLTAMICFALGAWVVGGLWILSNNGYLGG